MRHILFALITLPMLLNGCSLIPRQPEALGDTQSTIVATDMVQTLSLLRGYSPKSTTLQLRPGKSGFSVNLEQALRNGGYGLQYIADDDSGPMLVSYEVETFENTSGQSVGYRVQVGTVELSREYEINNGRVFPMTGMSVKGVEAGSKKLDRTLFDNQTVIVPVSKEKPFPDNPKTDGELLDDGWQQINTEPTSQSKSQPSEGSVRSKADALPKIKKNMFETGKSNFSDITSNYDVATEVVLVFPNDSMRIGSPNKSVLRKLADNFNNETDLVSVVGCSMGRTSIPNGNEFLAVGRANRVKEELIMGNVPTTSILDEGCWSPSKDASVPARGVVVTHRRLRVG